MSCDWHIARIGCAIIVPEAIHYFKRYDFDNPIVMESKMHVLI